MATSFVLGGEVSASMTRFSLYPAEPGGRPAASHTYRSGTHIAEGTFLFTGFEMMLADFVEKAKGACSAFEGVPAAACFALADEPASLPWAVAARPIEEKFGISKALVVTCEPDAGGGLVVAPVDGGGGGGAAPRVLPRQPDGTPWTHERATRQIATDLAANLSSDAGAAAERRARENQLQDRVAYTDAIPPVVNQNFADAVARNGHSPEAPPAQPAPSGDPPASPMERELAAARKELAALLEMSNGGTPAPADAQVPPPSGSSGFDDRLSTIRSLAPGGTRQPTFESPALKLEPEPELGGGSVPAQGPQQTIATPDTRALQQAQEELARAESALRQVSEAATHERSLRESLEREVSALRRQSSAASGDEQALQRAIEEGRRAQGELATAQSERAAAQQQLSRTTSERDAEKR